MTIDGAHRTADPASRPAVDLAPYIAWLATRVDDEATRRRCRLVAQIYLEWSWGDAGPAASRRSRFAAAAGRRLQLTRPQVEEALERLAEHRAIIGVTLPYDR